MDCIDKILEFYKNKDLIETYRGKVWIGQVLVRLMNLLEEDTPSNYLEVKNCLILMINLFFDIETPDHYHKKGKSTKELSESEKTQLADLLKTALVYEIKNNSNN